MGERSHAADGIAGGFRHSLAQLRVIVPPGRSATIWILALLTAAGAMVEVAAIGSVVPFLALLADAPAAARFDWLREIFGALGADSRTDQLLVATAMLCATAAAAGVFRIVLARMAQDFAFSIGHQVSVEAQRRMLLQPYSWHLLHNSSEQLAAIGKVEVVAVAVLLPLMQSIAAMILITVVVAALMLIAPTATIVAGAALGAGYFLLGIGARRRLRSNSQRLRTAFEQRIRIVQEGLGGIRDVILDGSHATILDHFRAVDSDLARARANSGFIATLPRYVIEPAGIIVIALLALFLSTREGGLVVALPVLGAVALGVQRLLPLVQQLYNGWSSLAANGSLVDDVAQRLKLPLAAVEPVGKRLPFMQAVEFRDASFTYPGNSEPSVASLSFTIPKGARVALVGPTGSGKSTTADLLMGLLDPRDGAILVDGTMLRADNRQAWRANIAHVPQMLFLADATVAQNIAMSETVEMDRVNEAASLAQLDEFVSGLPAGFDTLIGERGARLSGGQRQRLALARAIYKATPLLVLDEATSALDDETEAAVAAALDVLQEQGRTILIIAHRSRLIATCSGLVRLKNGRVVETTGDAAPGGRN